MRGMATYSIIGRAVANPEFKQVGSGLVKFTLAVNRMGQQNESGERDQKVDYFDCTAWRSESESGGIAGVIQSWVKKGTAVGIAGRMVQERWQDAEGKTRSKVVFEVRDITLLGDSQSAPPDNGEAPDAPPAQQPAAPAPTAKPPARKQPGKIPF